MNASAPSWRGKTCLVTGGVGFIGSHLCKRLDELGARLFVIDIEPGHAGTLFSILNGSRGMNVINTDLSNPAAANVVKDIHADYIFHLAALPYAPYTTAHPREAYASNVVSTVNVLEGARLSRPEKFVLASSACVFGAAQHSPLRVTDSPYTPEHYYSVTKQDAERQVNAFHQWHGVKAAVCRLGNVYGPGDRHFGRIVPQICRQLIKEGRDTLQLKRSKGDSVFEFLYVDDAVEAFIKAAEKHSDKVETFQFSSGKESRISIYNLVEKISEQFDQRRREVVFSTSAPEKAVQKYLDTSTAEELLDWKATQDLESGLNLTLEWYGRYIDSITPMEIN
ncbi:MAG TPA: NAD(P)-dependent oxidoreductase [Pyrinomonadaceae bacterium]|nr:NAD(P)-dependent oxidoreductase [Pyrinomonadaceae bacterium]